MKTRKSLIAYTKRLDNLIYELRGQRIMLDADLAEVYGVSTKALNQAVKRNRAQFPSDFMFRLTRDEAVQWRRSRSQFVTLKRGHNVKYMPFAFTEHGAIMAANVLKSLRARQMSVFVVRAFVRMRSLISKRHELVAQLTALEKKLTYRLDAHETAIVDVLRRVMKLLGPASPLPKPSRRRIGFRSK